MTKTTTCRVCDGAGVVKGPGARCASCGFAWADSSYAHCCCDTPWPEGCFACSGTGVEAGVEEAPDPPPADPPPLAAPAAPRLVWSIDDDGRVVIDLSSSGGDSDSDVAVASHAVALLAAERLRNEWRNRSSCVIVGRAPTWLAVTVTAIVAHHFRWVTYRPTPNGTAVNLSRSID